MYSGKPGRSSNQQRERDDVTDGGYNDNESENMSPGLRAAGPIHGDIIQEEDDEMERVGLSKSANRKMDDRRSNMSKQPNSGLRAMPSQGGLGDKSAKQFGGLDLGAAGTQNPGASEMGMGSSNASPSLKSLMTSKQGKT